MEAIKKIYNFYNKGRSCALIILQRMNDPKTQPGRSRALGWFLTYPKCDAEKEQLLAHCNTIAPVIEYVIAREQHKDGTNHLHAFIKYDHRIEWSDKKWDFLNYHGNYQVAKCWRAVERYCKKGDDYISSIEIASAKSKKGKHAMELAQMDPLEALESGDITIFQLNALVKNQQIYNLLRMKRRPDKPIIKIPKKRHSWIYGSSNVGKSQMLDELKSLWGEAKSFEIPYNNDWTGYNGQTHLYADEFKGQVPVTELNRMCDGDRKMNTKGGTVQLVKETEVTIFSNYPIEKCYGKVDEVLIESLNNRFNEYNKRPTDDHSHKFTDRNCNWIEHPMFPQEKKHEKLNKDDVTVTTKNPNPFTDISGWRLNN